MLLDAYEPARSVAQRLPSLLSLWKAGFIPFFLKKAEFIRGLKVLVIDAPGH